MCADICSGIWIASLLMMIELWPLIEGILQSFPHWCCYFVMERVEANGNRCTGQWTKIISFCLALLLKFNGRHICLLHSTTGIKKCDGKDICKKGHRKNKYLFSFPGLVASVAGGKFGELAQLDSRNPILYVDFPKVSGVSLTLPVLSVVRAIDFTISGALILL